MSARAQCVGRSSVISEMKRTDPEVDRDVDFGLLNGIEYEMSHITV